VAELDGKPVEILRADLAFRGVVLPAGPHEVRFSFQPFAPHALGEMAHAITTRRRLAEAPPTGSVICP
jgi:hypothetical protein